MNPRPEIVLPPGFALRIDYDPAASPSSLLITAYRDETPVGQAHVDPREVGLRLRLELEDGETTAHSAEPRLRLTPSRAMRAIVMGAVEEPVPPREVLSPPAQSPSNVEHHVEVRPGLQAGRHEKPHAALAALHQLAREGALAGNDAHADDGSQRPLNALVWLQDGSAVVLPSHEPKPEELPLTWMQRAFRALFGAAELLASPLRLREAEEGGPSWRAYWRGAPQAGGASEG